MNRKDAKALVITGFGLNCERETAAAFELVGLTAEQVHLNDLIAGARKLDEFQILAFIGGVLGGTISWYLNGTVTEGLFYEAFGLRGGSPPAQRFRPAES